MRAVSVAEVMSPTEAESAPLARDLMVALVRAGVTATCSSADKPRYGDLEVDSNLPDARIAVGGPDQNPFTAAVLAEADPAYAEELKRQLYASGTARVWVPAAAPLATTWLPGADLRGVRALPVLVIAGGNGLAEAVASVVEDLADAEITVDQQAPSELEPFEQRTVAVLNRGVPSFAVDTDGTLHTSLMRSCTGWPSGVWMDPQPRRTAPDGSNFQLQHWTHTFDYALVSGDGDWRTAAIPGRSAEFSHPLLAVVGSASAAGGLPSWGSLLEVEPAGSVQLGALKAAGNPLASGSSQAVDPAEAVAVRLVETCGATTDVAITSGLHRLSSASRVDLLEQSRLQKHRAFEGSTLHGYEIATVLTRLNMPQVLEADHAQLAPEAEAAQPLYARYWLHNRGPAPLGGLPAVAHLHPQASVAEPNEKWCFGLPRPATAPIRCCTARCGWCAPTAGRQPAEPAVRVAGRRASGGRHRADDAARHPGGALSGPRPTRHHRRRRGVDARVVAAGRRGRRHRVGRYARGGQRRACYLVGEPERRGGGCRRDGAAGGDRRHRRGREPGRWRRI